MSTSPRAPLDFVGIGAARCGTPLAGGALTPWVVWNKALPGIDVIGELPTFPILGKSYPVTHFRAVKAKG